MPINKKSLEPFKIFRPIPGKTYVFNLIHSAILSEQEIK